MAPPQESATAQEPTGAVIEEAGVRARLVVGMEVHVELATHSKMFTGAPNLAHPNHYDAEPNTLCDPVVIGMPGVLPVINKRAVEMSMLVGFALGCEIAGFTKWDRKSYYYPDLPKNYQISQYDQPLCVGGAIDIPSTDTPDAPLKNIRITRAHLEEDAGKLLHEAPGGVAIDHSIVDLNRAGTPLLEIVTEPDFDTPEQTVTFGQALRNICRCLGVSAGIMQKGHMRFEPNINVVIERNGETFKTPIVEIKNLNSFKALHGAVSYEFRRQLDDWLETGRVMGSGSKSTRGWDDIKQVTVLQREKEEAHDYRYFPDPDLVPVVVDDTWLESIRAQLPELPLQRERRYVHELGLGVKDAQALIEEPAVSDFYEQVLSAGVDAKRGAAILLNYGAKRANERGCLISDLGVTPSQIKEIVELSSSDKIGSSAADELFSLCCDPKNAGQSAADLAEKNGLLQVSDTGALDGFISQVVDDAKNAKPVQDVRNGKDKAIGALVGQVMKLSRGQANPKLVGQMIRERLSG